MKGKWRRWHVTDLRIIVGGRDGDQDCLWDWLRHEPDFRGHIRQGETPGPAGTMGASTELIVGVVSSGAATALVTSLQVRLTQRRADVNVSITGPQGRKIVLDA